MIEQNSANYTAWAYRRRCLLALHCSLQDELVFAERIAFSSPKNYQLWHHRRAIVDIVNQPGNELKHTVSVAQHSTATNEQTVRSTPTTGHCESSISRPDAVSDWVSSVSFLHSDRLRLYVCRCGVQEAILAFDAKNYHVWAYRSVTV